MNSPKNQQIEFDVFPKDAKSNYSYLSGIKNEPSSGTTPINVIFSHQSIIIVFIGIIMLLVASFTLGVEKGKLLSRAAMRPEKNLIAAANAPSATMSHLQVAAPLKVEENKVNAKETAPKIVTSQRAQEVQAVLPAFVATEAPVTETQPIKSLEEKPTAGGYVIQVASVKTQNAAKQLAENLAKKGWASFTKSSGKYVIVLAGNFSKKEDAQNKIKELKKTYTDCFIKKI